MNELQEIETRFKEHKSEERALKEYDTAFSRIADLVLNDAVMMINSKPHRFSEIEFYLQGGHHQDPFTHCDSLQQTCGSWYFHKTGNGYKGGSYKGLDISFGGPATGDSKAYGGILIRSIEPVTFKGDDGKTNDEDEEKEEEEEEEEALKKKKRKTAKTKSDNGYIEGPSLVVDRILKLCGAETIPVFVDKNFKGTPKSPPVAKSAGSKLYLTSTKELGKEMERLQVYRSPRVGLSLKRTREGLVRFVMKPYRYCTRPQLMKKGKLHLILALHHLNSMKVDEISKLMKTAKVTTQKYITDFENGKKKKPDSFQGSNQKTSETCELYGAVCALEAAKQ